MSNMISILFLSFVCICILVMFTGFKISVVRSGVASLSNTPRNFLIAILIWMVVLLILTYTGFISDFSTVPPRLMIVLMVPFATILYLVFSGKADRILSIIPHHWLVNMQAFRVIVELFLWWMFLEQMLPEQMTFEGLNFDIVAGLTAPIAAIFFFRNGNIKRTAGMIWNFAGLILLFNIVTVAVLSIPSPLRVFMNEPANTIVATFPYVYLPGILVPIAYSMHFLSIRQLMIRPSSD